jgi:OmpA-OmpF porin, OOP family
MSSRAPSVLFAFSLVASMLVASEANAQIVQPGNGEGIDTHLFRPAFDSRGLVSVNGADVLPANRISLGLTLDYGRNLLRLPDRPLVRDSFTGTFHFDYGIADRAVVGASLPALLLSGEGVDQQSFGWFALHGKVKLVKGVAASLQVGVPISDAARNGGADPSPWYWPAAIFEKRFGDNDEVRLAANIGYRGHAASGTTLALRDGRVSDASRLTYGAGASLRILEPLDLVVETYGTYLLGGATDDALRPSNEALGGIKLFVERSSHLVIAAGPRYTRGFEAADLRGVIGFVFEPPAYDRDGDGVDDPEDRCPDVPGPKSNDGCPLDSDGDGIPDVEDACPYVKGPRTNDPKTNGCPPIKDAVPPPPEDFDQDGIPNVEDRCPKDKGDPHPEDLSRHGCPDVLVGPGGITVFEKILFETASAKILPQSLLIVDKVAKAIKDHPEITLIEVAGHADERGGEKYNLELTQARVDSVMRALIERSVEASRLRSKGYGFYCPLEEGHDEAAWSKNRRVEFVVLQKADGPTDAPIGCDNARAHGVVPAPVP